MSSKYPISHFEIPEELRPVLKRRAEAYGISEEKLILSVIKFLEKMPLDDDEALVANGISRAARLPHFMEFLREVALIMNDFAEPVEDGVLNDYKPNKWMANERIYYAHASPNPAELPELTAKCLALKNKFRASVVRVVCNDTSSLPVVQIEELGKIGITFVELARFREAIARLKNPEQPREED